MQLLRLSQFHRMRVGKGGKGLLLKYMHDMVFWYGKFLKIQRNKKLLHRKSSRESTTRKRKLMALLSETTTSNLPIFQIHQHRDVNI